MAVEPNLKTWELVERGVSHQLSVPEFQRGFVWKPTQVRDLAESLWLEYPVGSVLIWNNQSAVEERSAIDLKRPTQWLVDGQQRTTALCILFGRKPYWWPTADGWVDTLRRYDIRFDVNAKSAPFFLVANAAIRKAHGDRYLKLSRLLLLDTSKEKDQRELMDLARGIKAQGLCDGADAMEVFTQLDRVRKIRERDLVTVTVNHELEHVVEIFSRLNSRGTRVTEADIYLGVVAARAPGWVRDKFLPFLKELRDYGFDINPNLLFRSLTAIAAGKTRFRDIPDSMWDGETIRPAWAKCQTAWKNIAKRLAEYGVLSNDPLPTEAALITLVALQDKFPDHPTFDHAFFWFLQASRLGRYSGSGQTSLDEDLRDLSSAPDMREAVRKLLRRIDAARPMTPEDFLRDYSDTTFGRFILYLIVWRNGARDWDERGHRLGFDGSKAMSDFRPQWHHIFPQKFLEDVFDDEQIQALANIAVIGSSINIRINAKDPLDYLDRYKISDDKLRQQFIPIERSAFATDSYPSFLKGRSEELALKANTFLNTLSEGLDLAALPLPEEVLEDDEPEDGSEAEDTAGDWMPTPEQQRAFRAAALKVEPDLRSLFPREGKWKRYKSERWLWVAFTRWEWTGFVFGFEQDETTRPYVGVYCDKKWVCDSLMELILPHEAEIKAALGGSVVIDPTDRWFPVYEYVALDKLDTVKTRMAEYVRVLSPYLEKVPVSRSGEAPSDDQAHGPIADLQLRFWTEFQKKVQGSGRQLRCPAPKAQSWLMFGSGSSAHPLVAVASQNRTAVYIAIKGSNRQTDFEKLLAQKEPIEKEFGQVLEWKLLPERKESQIFLGHEGKLTDAATWPSTHDWMLDSLLRMQKVLGPRIAELK